MYEIAPRSCSLGSCKSVFFFPSLSLCVSRSLALWLSLESVRTGQSCGIPFPFAGIHVDIALIVGVAERLIRCPLFHLGLEGSRTPGVGRRDIKATCLSGGARNLVRLATNQEITDHEVQTMI